MTRSPIRRYLRHGTLPQLALFEAAARLGSISRAAAEMHVAQPTASIHVRKLSDVVALPLFEPAGRGVRLTVAGARVQAACNAIFAILAELDQDLHDLRAPQEEIPSWPSKPLESIARTRHGCTST